MNESIGTGRGFHSPKKKLSFRNKESSIENVRRDLKVAKDISARNLMAKLDLEEQEKSDSDSTIEEVVMIEEETEEVDDTYTDDVEYIEEIIDDSDDDSYLEPLPPPIEIPRALQVKDDEDDNWVANEDSEDDSDDDESQEETNKKPSEPPLSIQVPSPPANEKPAPVQESKVEPEPSILTEIEPIAAKLDASPSVQYVLRVEPSAETNEESDSQEDEDELQEMKSGMPASVVKSVRPDTLRGMSYLEEDIGATITPKTSEFVAQQTTIHSINDESQPTDASIAWQKPDWTKNTKLRPTGKSTKEDLAKPITILPHLHHLGEGGSTAGKVTVPVSPLSSKQKIKSLPKTPTPSSKTTATEKRQCPKSAPSRPKAPVSMGDDDLTNIEWTKIEWTKPDWTRKKVLRDTSKGQKLMLGEEISRPIGGIRPVQK